jgi:hypothetical protein
VGVRGGSSGSTIAATALRTSALAVVPSRRAAPCRAACNSRSVRTIRIVSRLIGRTGASLSMIGRLSAPPGLYIRHFKRRAVQCQTILLSATRYLWQIVASALLPSVMIRPVSTVRPRDYPRSGRRAGAYYWCPSALEPRLSSNWRHLRRACPSSFL